MITFQSRISPAIKGSDPAVVSVTLVWRFLIQKIYLIPRAPEPAASVSGITLIPAPPSA